MPRGNGIWPSFLGFGADIATVGWPGSGELNVVGIYGDSPNTARVGLRGPGSAKWPSTTLDVGTFADDFHTFSADWYSDHIFFLVDGYLYQSQYRIAVGSGLVNQRSGRCLDLLDRCWVNGTPVQAWDCWGASNQIRELP
jgi:hypothetical protein